LILFRFSTVIPCRIRCYIQKEYNKLFSMREAHFIALQILIECSEQEAKY